MLEVPDDAVPQLESEFVERRPEGDIERHDFVIVNEVADLPTDRAILRQHADAFFNDPRLTLQIVVKLHPPLVTLSDVMGRRCDDQPRGAVRDACQEVEAFPVVPSCVPSREDRSSDLERTQAQPSGGRAAPLWGDCSAPPPGRVKRQAQLLGVVSVGTARYRSHDLCQRVAVMEYWRGAAPVTMPTERYTQATSMTNASLVFGPHHPHARRPRDRAGGAGRSFRGPGKGGPPGPPAARGAGVGGGGGEAGPPRPRATGVRGVVPPGYRGGLRTRPATARTLRGAASQIAADETTHAAIASQKAST